MNWRIPMHPGKRNALGKTNEIGAPLDPVAKLKTSMSAKLGHPFGIIKRQLGHMNMPAAD